LVNSPTAIKVIDLRNPQIRKLVMESLNDIIEERKKSSRTTNNRARNNMMLRSIVKSTPKTLRIQNSIDEEAVLIEKINMMADGD